MDLKLILFAISCWNALLCSPGSIFGFAALSIPPEVFLVTGGPTLSIATAVVATLLDLCGPRVVAICGTIVACVGYLLLAFSPPGDSSLLVHLGVVLLITGGFGPYLGGFNVGNLFAAPEKPISVITGLFVLAGLNYSIFHDAFGLDRRAICLCFAVLQAVGTVFCILGYPASPHLPKRYGNVVLAWVLPPREELPEPPQTPTGRVQMSSATSPAFLESPLLHEQSGGVACNAVADDAVRRGAFGITVPSFWRRKAIREHKALLRIRLRRWSDTFDNMRARSKSGQLLDENFWVQVFSPDYIGIVAWYCLNLTWCVYFFGIAGSQINDARFCTHLVYLGSGLPAILSIFVGAMISKLGWGLSTLMTTVSCMLMLSLSATQDLRLGYVALVLFAVQRGMTFANFFSYIPATFGSANYGRLIGLATIISGVFGCVNGPLSTVSGVAPISTAVCQGVACKNWTSCAVAGFALSATMLPLLFYSAWLSTRLSSFDTTPASTPCQSSPKSLSSTPKDFEDAHDEMDKAINAIKG